MMSELPYPGLRAFNINETHIFFGREDQTDELLRRLGTTRFLAVVGLSGCGKSSLVRAGLLAALETGFMAQAGARWRFAVIRPGGRPIQRLAQSLIKQAGLVADGGNPDDAAGFLAATLRRGPFGLVEALGETPLPDSTSLLVVVDQFEEIFRFRREGDSDEADAFVALLLASTSQRELPIYVVLTMRSDFFGHCAVFNGLPEAINTSQFLTPRLNRSQREAAIVGPARVFGGDVEAALVARLLNETGADPDQLPLLQHLLMRMWTFMLGSVSSQQSHGFTVDEIAPHVLTMRDYEVVGGLNEALSRHADEAFTSLDQHQQRIAELMMRRLSERGADQRGIRRPTPAGEIAVLCGVDMAELVNVVDVFRAPSRSFLTPPWPEPISAETVLDICHESLIRHWSRLRDWSEQEAMSAETFRFLDQTARRWRKGEAALWSTPDLENALAWRDRQQPSTVWACRYGGELELALDFLHASERKQQDDTAARRRRERRVRQALAGLAVICMAFVASISLWLYFYVREYGAYYNTFIEKWGVPVGYGSLTDDQVRQRPSSIKIVKRGRWGPVIRMEAVDSRGQCKPDNPVVRPLSLGPDTNPLTGQKNSLQECRWEFVRDASGQQLIYETAYNRRHGEVCDPSHEEACDDRNRGLVWGLAYAPSTDRLRRQAYFVGPDGSLQLLKNPRLHSVEIDYSKDGVQISRKYWSYSGGSKHPEPGEAQAYGVARQYDRSGLPVRIASLGKNQITLMNDTAGNSIQKRTYDALGNVVEETEFDKDDRPVLVKEGYFRIRMQYDKNGNLTSKQYFDVGNRPVVIKNRGYHEIRMRYENGDLVEQAFFDVDGKPVDNTELMVHAIAMKYKNGRIAELHFYDSHGNPEPSAAGQYATKLTYDDDGNAASLQYFDDTGKPAANQLGVHRTDWRKYDTQGRPLMEYFSDTKDIPARPKGLVIGGIAIDDAAYGDQLEYDDRGAIKSIRFFDRNERSIRGSSGYALIRFGYDDRGNQTMITYLDEFGNPVRVDKIGYAKLNRVYDERGNVKREELFDDLGNLALGNDGYAAVERTYDERDRVVSESYFGADGKPILIDGRYAILSKRYDRRDNVIEEAYLNADRAPIASSYALVRTKYDDHDRITEQAYYGADGRRVASDGYAILRRSVGNDGKTYTLSFFDVSGQPTRDSEGCWNKRRTEDGRGNVLELVCLDQTLMPSPSIGGNAAVRQRYDERGNLIEKAFVDTGGVLFQMKAGYARLRQTFDESGEVTEQAYYGADGKPLLQPSGYAKVRNKYDGPYIIEHAYYGTDGKLLVQSEGHAVVREKYDDRGDPVEWTYYGADDKLLVQPDGYAIVRQKYDNQHHVIESTDYDLNGKPSINMHGFAIARMQYDERGELIHVAYFDPDGRPLCRDAVYVKFCSLDYAYNRSGQKESTTYADIAGHPLVTVRYMYDAQGKAIGTSTKGKDGEIVVYHQMVRAVLPHTQAERLLRPGDIILRYGGKNIDSPESLPSLTSDTSGGVREVDVLRDGKVIELHAQPGKLGFIDQVTFSASK